MKLTAKWSFGRLKAKLRAWERHVDQETADSLKEYGQTVAKAMLKCTPPSNARRGTPAKALRAAKERIKADFEGDGLEPFSETDVYWITVGGKQLARISGKNDGRPSPFRVVAGGVDARILESMNVGKYHVKYVTDLGTFMQSSAQYYMGRRKGGRVYGLKWTGPRHVTTEAAVRAEIRRRQHLVGKLMGGWQPLCKYTGVRMPADAARQAGNGTAQVVRSAHKAELAATNKGHYPGLQRIINRQLPGINRKNKKLAKKRAERLAAKMKTA